MKRLLFVILALVLILSVAVLCRPARVPAGWPLDYLSPPALSIRAKVLFGAHSKDGGYTVEYIDPESPHDYYSVGFYSLLSWRTLQLNYHEVLQEHGFVVEKHEEDNRFDIWFYQSNDGVYDVKISRNIRANAYYIHVFKNKVSHTDSESNKRTPEI